MRKLSHYLVLLFVSATILISCVEDEEILFAEVAAVKVDKVYSDGADISWTVINPENTTLTFDVYINSNLVQKDVTEKNIKISKLKANTSYSGKIIVKSNGKVSPEKSFTFKTLDSLFPSEFEITSSDITPKSALLKWTESTVKDDSKITYYLYADSKLLKGNLTERTYNLKELTPNKKYDIKIVALSTNGKQVHSEISFSTPDFDSPTTFEVNLSDKKPTSALLNWTPSSVADGSGVEYSVYINDKLIKEKITERTLLLNNLLPITKYQVKVVALSGNGKKQSKKVIFTSSDYPSPSDFTTSITEITPKGALVSWTKPTIEDNSKVTYSIYLNEVLLSSSLNVNNYTLKNLVSSKKYYVKVIAKSIHDKKTASETSFLTKNTPSPSPFNLSIEGSENDPKNTKIKWTPSVITDKSLKISYEILLNNNPVATVNEDVNDFIFTELFEGTSYKVRVIAKGSNGTQTASNEVLLTTITYPKIANFTLNKTVNNNVATINWTKATLNGKDVSYKIKINNQTYIDTKDLSYTFKDLPIGDYTVEVIAKGAYKDDFISKTETIAFKIIQSYPKHPTISIQKATLYSKSNTSFPKQLIVKFSESINNLEITAFYVSNFTINNFMINSSSIVSGKLNDVRYESIESNKTGYILLKEGEATYKIPFNVVIE